MAGASSLPRNECVCPTQWELGLDGGCGVISRCKVRFPHSVSLPVRESSGPSCAPYLMKTWRVPKRKVSSGNVFVEQSPQVCLLQVDVLSAY